jgi:hypothetical protein
MKANRHKLTQQYIQSQFWAQGGHFENWVESNIEQKVKVNWKIFKSRFSSKFTKFLFKCFQSSKKIWHTNISIPKIKKLKHELNIEIKSSRAEVLIIWLFNNCSRKIAHIKVKSKIVIIVKPLIACNLR